MFDKLCDAKNTFEGKALAVFMAVVMAFSLSNLTSFANATEGDSSSEAPAAQGAPGDAAGNEATESAQAGDPETAAPAETPAAPVQGETTAPSVQSPAPSADLPVAEPGVAVVSLDFEHAYVKYLDQDLKAPLASFNAPLNKELAFTAHADTGYEIDKVKAVVNGAETELAADEQTGEYKVPADLVTSNLTIQVEAKAAEAESPAPEDSSATPITSDTKIEAGDTAGNDVDNAVEDEDVVKVEADVSNPAFEGYAYVGDVVVKVTAGKGVLPEGTTVQAAPVERQDVVDAVAEKIENQGKTLESATAIDVTLLDKDGNEIQPNGAVNVCFFDTNVEGEEVGVYRVSDDAATVETIGTRQADTAVQSFDVDHFTIYVVGGSKNDTNGDGSMNSKANRYEAKPGDTVELKNDSWKGRNYGWTIIDGASSAEIVSEGEDPSDSYLPIASVKINSNAKAGSSVVVRYAHDLYPDSNKPQYFYITVVTEGFAVDFDLNGGSGIINTMYGDQNKGIELPDGSDIVAPAGKRFVGWSDNKKAKDPKYNAGDLYKPSKNTTLYAVYADKIPVPATAIQIAGEDSIGVGKTTKLEASLIPATTTDTVTWASSDSSVATVDKNGVVSGKSVGSVTITAKAGGVSAEKTLSVEHKHTITYVPGKGSGTIADQVVTDGDSVTLSDGAGFTLESNRLVGWRDQDWTTYALGETITPAGDLTLTAMWNQVYTVTFDPNGAQGTSYVLESTSSTITLPTPDACDFTYPGHTFVGWSTDKSGGGSNYVADIQNTIKSGMTYYAIWVDNSAAKDQVAYFYVRTTGGQDGIKPEPAGYPANGYYPKNGEEGNVNINGVWYNNSGKIKQAVAINNNELVASNIASEPRDMASIVRAQGGSFDPATQKIVWYVIKHQNNGTWHVDGVIWDKGKYSVTYHSNGGEVTAVPSAKQYAEDSQVKVEFDPSPTRTGYKFVGWDTDAGADPNNVMYPVGSSPSFKMGASNVDLYAIWAPNLYTVSYVDGVDNEVVFPDDVHAQCAYESDTPDFSDGTPQRLGYKFAGWEPTVSKTVLGDATYAAVWQAVNSSYTVHWIDIDTNEPIKPDDVRSANTDTPVAVKAADKIIPGYEYVAEGSVTSGTVAADGSLALTLNFKKAQVPYTVHYYLEGTETPLAGDTLGKGIYGTTVEVSAQSIPGYTVVGPATQLLPLLEPKNNETIFYYSADAASIVFEENGGSEVADLAGRTGEALASTAMPTTTRAGYTFAGWYDNAQLSGPEATALPAAYPAGTTTYWAKWTANPYAYTVKYVDEAGKSIADSVAGEAAFGSTVKAADYNTKAIDGYTYKSDTGDLVMGLDNNVMTVTYTANPYAYTVKYVDEAGKSIADSVAGEAAFGSTVKAADYNTKAIDGYTYKSDTGDLVMGLDNNVMTVTYTADFSDLTATGFEVTYDGGTHNVQVGGTILPTDTVEYWVGNTKLPANEFVNVADSAEVTVKVIRGEQTWTSDPVTAKINPASVAIVVNSDTKVYGAVDPTFSGTVSGLVANGDLGEITYGRLAADANKENVDDDITLTASYTDNGNYDVTVTNGKLTITPSDENAIVATGITKTYDGQVASIVANAAQPNSTIEYSVDGQNWTTNNPTFTDVGTYTVQARAINPNFAQVIASADVVVSPATITATANNQTKVAGTADPELTYAFSGVVNNEVARFMGGLQRETGEDVGSYAINQGDLALVDNGDFRASNYTLEFVPGTLVVTAALIPVTPPTPPTPTPAPTPTPGTPPADDPLAPIVAPIAEVLADAVTPLAGPQEETISDNDNPLAGYDRVNCWVHYYLILGIIVTVIYGGGVLVRRINFTRKLKGYEDDVLGVEDETATATAAAPMATEGKEA